MTKPRRIVALLLGGLIGAGIVQLGSGPANAGSPGTEHRPDLQTIIPAGSFSVVNPGTGREFRYTHLIYNNGP